MVYWPIRAKQHQVLGMAIRKQQKINFRLLSLAVYTLKLQNVFAVKRRGASLRFVRFVFNFLIFKRFFLVIVRCCRRE